MPISQNSHNHSNGPRRFAPGDRVLAVIDKGTHIALEADLLMWREKSLEGYQVVLSIDRSLTDPWLLDELDRSSCMDLAFRKAGWWSIVRRLIGIERKASLDEVRCRTRYVLSLRDSEGREYSPKVGEALYVLPVFDDPRRGDMQLAPCRLGVIADVSA